MKQSQEFLAAMEQEVKRVISPRDEMFIYARSQLPSEEATYTYYFETGKELATGLLQYLLGSGLDPEELDVLDFAAGYGRVTRWLVPVYRSVTMADLEQEMIDFHRQELGVEGFVSSHDPRILASHGQDYDIVFVFSLFTHLPSTSWRAWLNALAALVRPGGHLLLSTHSYELLAQMNPAQFGDPGTWVEEFVFWEANETGGRLETSVYGSNVVKDSYVRNAINELEDIELIYYYKMGELDRYHDMYLIRKNKKSMFPKHQDIGALREGELPPGFDPRIYLAIHKDVAEAGVDPIQHYLMHGQKEGRRFVATRAEILLGPINRGASIIEVGAGYNPIAPKMEGWNTKTIDVAARAGLIDRYRGQPGVDVDRIEEVDFIWRDGALSGAVPTELHGSFDAFIASHVIEHAPDMLAFLNSAATLLAATGVVILAIPDKRFCFDYFRPLALTGDVLASHSMRRNRHSRQTIFNHIAYAVSANGSGAWAQHSVQSFVFCHSLEKAYSAFLISSEDDASPYVDMHAWQFTPASFQLLLLELARLKLTDWRVDWIGPALGCEFHVWLCRGGQEVAAALTESELNEQRLALLKRTLVEMKQQIRFLEIGQPNNV
jgi:2-polyprenyl-3-methyl-5-hydroxy-6-metoxy-1,4-benzoquinol methylase